MRLGAELGADEVVETAGDPVAPRVLGHPPDGVDFALDTTGVAPVMRRAIEALAPRGTFGFVAAPLDGGEEETAVKPIPRMNRPLQFLVRSPSIGPHPVGWLKTMGMAR